MAARDRSFTVNVIPHDANRKRREWIISGGKLMALRILVAVICLLVLTSAYIIVVGAGEVTRSAELSERNGLLRDSLAMARELNARLDAIELELQEIRETRDVIENLATAGLSEESE